MTRHLRAVKPVPRADGVAVRVVALLDAPPADPSRAMVRLAADGYEHASIDGVRVTVTRRGDAPFHVQVYAALAGITAATGRAVTSVAATRA